MFVREKNLTWPWLIDLYQAVVLFDAKRDDEARRLAAGALDFFRAARMAGKEILSHLLLARIARRGDNLACAREHCRAAQDALAAVQNPHLLYQAHLIMGEVEEAAGDPGAASASYGAARTAIESMREALRSDELKIAFMRNKLEVYENLVRLCLDRTTSACPAEEVLLLMEEAKSRSLRDLFFEPAREAGAGDSPAERRIHDLREELNWYYHRIQAEETAQEAVSAGAIAKLRSELQDREKMLVRMMRELPESARESLGSAPPLTLDAIRAELPADTVLIEYFRTRDRFVAATLSKDSLEITFLCSAAEIQPVIRLLQFQFSKFILGQEYIKMYAASSLPATRSHLTDLYHALIAPIRQHLRGNRLVFVPHEQLHHLPLHALYDGERYLADDFAISYAPSASIFAGCQRLSDSSGSGALVLSVPDAQAPLLEAEARTVTATLPGAELYSGEDATLRILRERGRISRYIHIATHGQFRRDNPTFSSVRLGDGPLTVYDLHSMRLPAELVTLSGCSTGMNVIAKGDELLGLVRGLLNSGARTLMLSLWDVQDRAAAELMKQFYSRLQTIESAAEALRQAMLDIRQTHSHPFYWAPFFLTGRAK
jgi:CHAT domain-containing protein